MAITLDALDQAQTPTGPPRDRYGRYVIPDPETGKPRSWMRATTLAKTLEDPTNLTNWKARMVAQGVAARPSIAAGITAAQGDRSELNRLVEQAQEAAGANEGRETGTHLHRILELVDTGHMQLADVPDPWASDVRAYQNTLRHNTLTVNPHLCEVVLLNAALGVAGMADNIYTDHDGQLVVADKKTGGYIAWLSFAMQFAIYATATHIFNPATGELTPAPTFRQDHTLMVHVPAGKGRCDITALSVPEGYDAVLMALEVRRIRAKDKPKYMTATTWQPPILQVAPDPTPDDAQRARHLRADLVTRIAWLRVNDPDLLGKVARQWPDTVPTLTQSIDHTLQQLQAIADVFNQLSVPF
jgi:hypothetical protein